MVGVGNGRAVQDSNLHCRGALAICRPELRGVLPLDERPLQVVKRVGHDFLLLWCRSNLLPTPTKRLAYGY